MTRLSMLAFVCNCSIGEVIEDMMRRDDASDLIDAMRIDGMSYPSPEWIDSQMEK